MMLQRAASNAYSWWWASHIRTKQSKWLEQNLQDIEEKVQYVLKLLEEDGDSFAKRAEMYYKRRPELINFVEESFKAYRALAERYDHLSTDLQKANTTIASVFPDQVPQFDMDDDDVDAEVKARFAKKKPTPPANVPNVPKPPVKDFKGLVSSAAKKLQPKKLQPYKSMKSKGYVAAKSSGLSKPEAMEEIDKLQKEILTMQTEKEFVKSSYESGLAKYWEIENGIKDKQGRICNLQDEFGEIIVIEDNEARKLMTETAIKSCQEKLVELQEKQEKSLEEAKEEHRRIKESKEKLKSMAGQMLGDENVFMKDDDNKYVRTEEELEQEMKGMTQKKKELGSIREKIKEHFEAGADSSVSATEMAEKIDDLANKVIGLETAVSSQAALIQRLRTETNDLQGQIRTLEDNKSALTDDKNELRNRLKEMEEKLKALQDLDRNLMDQSGDLQSNFDEACSNLDQLSWKLQGLESGEGIDNSAMNVKSENEPADGKSNIAGSETKEVHVSKVRFKDQDQKLEKSEDPEEAQNVKTDVEETAVSDAVAQLCLSTDHDDNLEKSKDSEEAQHVRTDAEETAVSDAVSQSCPSTDHDDNLLDSSEKEDIATSSGSEKQNSSDKMDLEPSTVSEKQISPGEVDDASNSEARANQVEKEDEPDWKQLFLKGMEDREKHLLTEYTTALRHYKDVKRKLGETEMKLKNEKAMKDDEIRLLQEKVMLLQKGLGESSDLMDSKASDNQRNDENCLGMMISEQNEKMSPVEEQFRMNIDELLEENLDFWLRFSTSFSQIQKFDTSIEDLQTEISKLDQRKKQEGSSTTKYTMRSDARPIYRHLKEIQTELSFWLEKGAALKDELKSRFESVCNIQDEITKALKASAEDDDFRFTSYQAAKFQGEVLNMKQENNKVADELQAGLDHVTTLQLDVEKTLAKLGEEFGISVAKDNIQLQHSDSRARIPLRSFIFGSKQKKTNKSIFSCMHPSLYRNRKPQR